MSTISVYERCKNNTYLYCLFSKQYVLQHKKNLFFLLFRQNYMMIVFTYFPDVSGINIKSPSIPAGIEGLFV